VLFRLNLNKNNVLRKFLRVSVLLVVLTASMLVLGQSSDAVDNNAEAQNQDVVDNIRIWHSPNNTRIVFDVSSDVRQSMFTLQNPLRLVVDIQNGRLNNKLPSLEPSNEHISRIRSGQPQEGTLRFVFELKKDLLPSNFVLSPNELYGHRLVIDLDEKQVDQSKPASADSNDAPDTSTPIVEPLEQPNSAKDTNSESRLQVEPESAPKPEPKKQLQQQQIELNQIAPPIKPASQPGSSSQQDNKLIVAIDAGHGGEDPGALGHRGSLEKKLTLSIAKRLKKKIDKDPDMQAVLIRTGDYYIKLHQRRQMARNQDADIFVSIHADAFTRKSARGFSVFALSQSGATSAMARALAAKENASDRIGGVSLADKDAVLAQVLVDLSMTNTISESVNLGGRVLKELGKLGKLHSKRVEQAGFAVLKSPDMPSILVETGFITNPEEERLLRSSKYQKKVANAIYKAIDEYYEQTPYVTNQRFAKASYTPPNTASGKKSSKSNEAPRYHVVKRGDSLSKISARYNVTIKALKRLNKTRKNTVYIGQKIKLPANAVDKKAASKKAIVHKVKRGDNLSELAQKYDVTINAIMSLNKLKKPTIFIGQRIKIP